MFDIIIRDNLDISSIVDIFKNLFKKIITNNFEKIEKASENKLITTKIISNCYSIILSNFSYTIQLIQSNFGLNGKRIFNEVFEMMKNEMDELVKALILAYLHEKVLDIESSWFSFLKELNDIKLISIVYFQNSKLIWDEMITDIYQDYFTCYHDIKTKEFTEEFKQYDWEQVTNINEQYQLMFDILNKNQNINKIIIEPNEIILLSNNNGNNNIEEKKDFLIIKNENNENDKNHKISKISLDYIKFAYEYLVIYASSPNNLKDIIMNKIMKLTKDILESSSSIIINSTGKINDKQITEKETALYYSDLIIIQKCIKNFIDAKNFGNMILNIKEVVDSLNSLKNTCFDVITELTQDVSTSFLNDFNTLNFSSYKTFESAKEYNSYIKKLTTIKKLYDNIGNSFLTQDINKIFSQLFDNMFNQFKHLVLNKGIIEKDEHLKQFRNELNYIKKVFKFFSIVDCAKYKEIIDDLIIKVNPNKLPKKKKKAKHVKEEDNNDANED